VSISRRGELRKAPSVLFQRLAAALCFYVIPLGATILYALRLLPPDRGRELMAYGLLLGGVSTTVFIIWLRRLQQPGTAPPSHPEPAAQPLKPQGPVDLQRKLAQRDETVALLQQQLMGLRTQLEQAQGQGQHQLLQKQAELDDLSKSVQDQRQLIQKKQLRIARLENKVRDLDYEVKTLLQLDDLRSPVEEEPLPPLPRTPLSSDSAPPVWEGEAKNGTEASIQLHRLVASAQRLTGMAHLSGQLPRYTAETSALDLRRLFDQLQDDPNVVLAYSQSEGQLLFANGQVRHQLGWHPDRFIKEFFQIIQHGGNEWHRAAALLDQQGEARVKLALKHRDGHDLFTDCVMSRISQGPFSGLILALIYKG